MTCLFCNITSEIKAQGLLYEDDLTLVILDQDWAVKGHTLVIFKKHIVNLSELKILEYLHLMKVLYQIEKMLLQLLSADKSVILKSGGLQSHLHFHIYPVNKDTSWTRLKEIFDKKIRYNFTQAEKEELIAQIRSKLNNLNL